MAFVPVHPVYTVLPSAPPSRAHFITDPNGPSKPFPHMPQIPWSCTDLNGVAWLRFEGNFFFFFNIKALGLWAIDQGVRNIWLTCDFISGWSHLDLSTTPASPWSGEGWGVGATSSMHGKLCTMDAHEHFPFLIYWYSVTNSCHYLYRNHLSQEQVVE